MALDENKKIKMEDISDEEFLSLCVKHKRLTILSVKLGCPNVSIHRRAKKIGFEFKNKGVKHKRIPTKDIIEGKYPEYNTARLKKRLVKEGLIKNQCNKCSISKWMGEPISLQLDHIDGDRHNHILKNLRILCPNCHSQTNTFSGRSARKYKPCKICGDDMFGNRKTCSKKCLDIALINNAKNRIVFKNCIVCNKKFSKKDRKTCSDDCFNKIKGNKKVVPDLELLSNILKLKMLKGSADYFNVSVSTVQKWKKEYGL